MSANIHSLKNMLNVQVLHYIYSNINKIIQDINNKIFYIINSDNVRKYNSYNNLISEMYKEKENVKNNNFIYICK